jgi:hypothetical protein
MLRATTKLLHDNDISRRRGCRFRLLQAKQGVVVWVFAPAGLRTSDSGADVGVFDFMAWRAVDRRGGVIDLSQAAILSRHAGPPLPRLYRLPSPAAIGARWKNATSTARFS